MTSPRRGSAGKKDTWKVKSLRSTFGPQCLARIATAPASGFGSSLRDTASKVHHDHTRLLLPDTLCPSPHCMRKPSLSATIYSLDATDANPPKRSFCVQTYVSPAVDKALGKSQGGNNSPGPIYMQLVRPLLAQFSSGLVLLILSQYNLIPVLPRANCAHACLFTKSAYNRPQQLPTMIPKLKMRCAVSYMSSAYKLRWLALCLPSVLYHKLSNHVCIECMHDWPAALMRLLCWRRSNSSTCSREQHSARLRGCSTRLL